MSILLEWFLSYVTSIPKFRPVRPLSMDEIRQELLENSCHPFSIIDPTIASRVLSFQTYDEQFYVSCWFLLGSLSMVVLCFFMFEFSNPLVLISLTGVSLSAAFTYIYAGAKEYTLDEGSLTYFFVVGNKLLVHDQYHNIYIRLRRHFPDTSVEASLAGKIKRLNDGFGTSNSGDRNNNNGEREAAEYFIVFSGYGLEPIQLTYPSPNKTNVRTVARHIAQNLNLNYFDETNISREHRVIHYREDQTTMGGNTTGEVSPSDNDKDDREKNGRHSNGGVDDSCSGTKEDRVASGSPTISKDRTDDNNNNNNCNTNSAHKNGISLGKKTRLRRVHPPTPMPAKRRTLSSSKPSPSSSGPWAPGTKVLPNFLEES